MINYFYLKMKKNCRLIKIDLSQIIFFVESFLWNQYIISKIY